MTAGFRASRYMAVSTSSRRLAENNFTYGFDPVSGPPPSRYPPREGSYISRSFNSNVVVVMAVLLFALVVAAFINTVARCILRRRRPQHTEDHAAANKGLDKNAIEALPVVAYGAEAVTALFDPAGGNECVVCLSEFVNGEKLRLLPDCQHRFHLACIDTWLLTHTTCPVCRRGVLGPAAASCSDDSDDPSCAAVTTRSVIGSSARFGSSRFGSARIASVDIEIEPTTTAIATTTDPAAASSSSSATTRPPKRSFASLEAMANIINGRRFGGGRSQGQL
jgi:E3 ubiquitin-protein ligase ATL10/75/76/77/78